MARGFLLVISTVALIATPAYLLITPMSIEGSNLLSHPENLYLNPDYYVLLDSKGLPDGALWNVTISGKTYSSTSDDISLSLMNGEYNFTASTLLHGYSWDNLTNEFTVNSSNEIVNVLFIPGQYVGNISVQSHPHGIAFDPHNNYMYVVNTGQQTISVINASNIVIENISVPFSPCEIVFDPYNDYLYVTNQANNTVSVINQSNVVIQNISVQKYPLGIAYDSYNNFLYVSNLFSNTVSVINQSNVVIKNITIPCGPVGIAFDPYNDYIYVTNSNELTVSVINKANVVIKNITIQSFPTGIAYDPYNNFMYVTNVCTNAVSVINKVNVVIKNITVQSFPTGIAYDPYNNFMYVTNECSNSVSVINQSNVVIRNITVQSSPYTIAFDAHNNYMYTTNSGSNSVTVLNSSYGFTFYKVRLIEGDLPNGATWKVKLSTGLCYSSTSNSVLFLLDSGEYSYFASTENLSFHAYRGILKVSGNITVNVNFTLVTYRITIKETGLYLVSNTMASSSPWYVNLSNGQSFSSRNGTISFLEPNGTYYLSAVSEGYTSEFTNSMNFTAITINGSSVTEQVTFKEITLKISADYLIEVGGAVSLILAAVAIVYFLPRKMKTR